jgi:hypothetical protein
LLWHHPVDAPLKLLKILLYILTDGSRCSVCALHRVKNFKPTQKEKKLRWNFAAAL